MEQIIEKDRNKTFQPCSKNSSLSDINSDYTKPNRKITQHKVTDHSYMYIRIVVSQWRPIARPKFDPRSGNMGFMVGKMLMVQVPPANCHYTNCSIKQKQTQWPEYTSELYQPSDCSLLPKLMPTFVDKVVLCSRPYSRFYRPEPLLFLPGSSSVVLTRLSGPRSRPITSEEIW
jgi:hypothetical protein